MCNLFVKPICPRKTLVQDFFAELLLQKTEKSIPVHLPLFHFC